MKICIIGFGNIRHMPYLNLYLENMLSTQEVEIFTWNRDGSRDAKIESNYNVVYYSHIISNVDNLIKKIPAFWGYRKALYSYLSTRRFDRIIILHTPPAVLLKKYLIKNYEGKYLIDYRDITYEKISAYRNIIDELISNSYVTLISSPGFMRWLSSEKLLLAHNIDMSLLGYSEQFYRERNFSKQRIVIRYWGQIRQTKINIRLIDEVARDSRFELHYHGTQNRIMDVLRRHASNSRYDNIYFHGEYEPKDRIALAQSTDIIDNCYDAGKTEKYAMGNKYYDSALFGLPQICNIKTFMGKKVGKDGLGISVDPFSCGFLDTVYDYYTNLDRSRLIKNCRKFLDECLCEQKAAISAIVKFTASDER